MKSRAIRSIVIVMIAALVFTMMPMGVFAASNKPGKAKITSYKVGKVSKKTSKTTVTVKWKRVSKATGYEVWEKHGTDKKWKKVKKTGRFFIGMRIKKVPSGKYSVKVRAIRKYRGKTYKGKFSKAKTKFIKSPLTLQQLGNKYPTMKKSKYPYQKISFSGNTAIYTYDITKMSGYDDYPKDFWESPEVRTALYDEIGRLYGKEAAKDKKSLKDDTGVSGVAIKIVFAYGSTELISRSF